MLMKCGRWKMADWEVKWIVGIAMRRKTLTGQTPYIFHWFLLRQPTKPPVKEDPMCCSPSNRSTWAYGARNEKTSIPLDLVVENCLVERVPSVFFKG